MANVVLYDKNSNSDVYSVGRGIRMYTDDGGIQDFLSANAENLDVQLDFSNENIMVIEPSADTVFERVSITKPANLIPENVAEGVDISGVIGTLKGGGGFELDGFAKYLVYQIDEENKEITIYGILWSQFYSDTGKYVYDVEIPSRYGEYQVVVSSEGLV